MCASLPIVGLIPAAGFARRVSSHISVSKEIFPIMLTDGSSRPVASFLIDSFHNAGADKAYLVLREGKWDIPESLADDKSINLPLSYIITESTNGVSFTLDKGYSFVKDSMVLLGFPDIIFRPINAFQQLLQRQQETGADLVLGLFKTKKPHKADMVALGNKNELLDIVIKPERTTLSYTWIMAVWTPLFTHFLHDYLIGKTTDSSDKNNGTGNKELHIGNVVRDAIKAGINTSYITFDEGFFLDIGTPDDLKKAANGQLVDRLFTRI